MLSLRFFMCAIKMEQATKLKKTLTKFAIIKYEVFGKIQGSSFRQNVALSYHSLTVN